MSLFRSKAEQKLVDKGLDPARLPPGQYLTEKWPVLHAGTVPRTDLATWDFKVWGEVGAPLRVTWDELQRLPATEITADIHCVTRWSRFDNRWMGVAFREVLKLAPPQLAASHVLVHAEQGFTANVPLADLDRDDVLLATHHDGEPLTGEHGYPVRLIVPHLYAWKSVKWTRGLEFLDRDVAGFWERNGYHMYGDPWREQRFDTDD